MSREQGSAENASGVDEGSKDFVYPAFFFLLPVACSLLLAEAVNQPAGEAKAILQC